MPNKSYCVVHLKGQYDDFKVVSVSGVYSKSEAKAIVDSFGSKLDNSGNWQVKEVAKYNNK